jgi:hypothetical protein
VYRYFHALRSFKYTKPGFVFCLPYFWGIACGPRCPLYLFFKKDAAAIANAAMPANKVHRFHHGFAAQPICPPRSKRLPHPGSLVCRTLRSWQTRPPVLRQALAFPDVMFAFCRV